MLGQPDASEAPAWGVTGRFLPLGPWEDASILAKLYPCLGQGIHNSRDHNIPYLYEFDGRTNERTVAPALPHGGRMRFAGLAGAYTPQTSKLPLSSTSRFE